jgi:hypothetical protein
MISEIELIGAYNGLLKAQERGIGALMARAKRHYILGHIGGERGIYWEEEKRIGYRAKGRTAGETQGQFELRQPGACNYGHLEPEDTLHTNLFGVRMYDGREASLIPTGR